MKKSAIVTGSARGIGYAIATQLGKDGFDIVMVDVGTEESNAEAIEQLKKQGTDVLYVQADISKHDDRLRIVDEAIKKYGRIDALVNNAGVAPLERADLLTMSEESWDRVIGINTKGNMFLTQAVANAMVKQELINDRRGVIVNVSSCSTNVSSVNRGEYCVSKAGVTCLTMLYADRLAKEGIIVNEVRPGVIDTKMTSTVHDKYNKLIAEGAFPIARWGKPEDVANAVSVFCSDKILYSTGNYLDIDGGFHIKRL